MHHLHATPGADACTCRSPMCTYHTCSIPGRKGGREAAPPPPACCIACWAGLDAVAEVLRSPEVCWITKTALMMRTGVVCCRQGRHTSMDVRTLLRTLRRAPRPTLRLTSTQSLSARRVHKANPSRSRWTTAEPQMAASWRKLWPSTAAQHSRRAFRQAWEGREQRCTALGQGLGDHMHGAAVSGQCATCVLQHSMVLAEHEQGEHASRQL